VAQPINLLCSGYELRYSSSAIDMDLDSISYDWSPTYRYDGGALPVTYQPGFTYSSPLPSGFDQVTIDPLTGMIDYDTDPGLVGRWSMTISAFGWRRGVLVSENSREFTLETMQCSVTNNQVPQVNGAANTNITVNAGDPVNFTIGATDLDQPNGVPQTVSLTAISNMFGANFTSASSGCVNPPCATLNNITPPASGVTGISSQFSWQTECNHVYTGEPLYSATYNFVFRFEDDHCPTPGVSYANVRVTVLADPVLPSPEPHCASVLVNGDVQLSWEPITPSVPVPVSFAYVICHSTSPTGPFTEVGTVTDVTTGTYTHTSGGGSDPISNGANYYEIKTRSGCVTLPVTEDAHYVISTIYLAINNTGPTADLSWTPVTDPPLPSSNGNGQGLYQIFRESPIGTWTMIGSTFDHFFIDPVTVCSEQVNYRIELTDNLPCNSVSNIAGDVFMDPTGPDPQFLDSVSVSLITGNAILGWEPNPKLNVTQYVIEQNNLGNPPVFTNSFPDVMGYNNTFWENPSSPPGMAMTEVQCYRIKAKDNCGVVGDPGPSDQIQCTMLLDVELEPCDKTNRLTWTNFFRWDEGVKEYEILVSKDGGPELKIAINDAIDTTFDHAGLQLSATYCYRVRAVRNVPDRRITSSSNQECELVFISKIPEYHYAYKVSVPNNDQIMHEFFIDSTAGITGFEILRGQTPETSGYVGEVEFLDTTRFFHYSDYRAKPDIRAYYFATVVLDACDEPMDTSNFVRTIFLDAEAKIDRTNILTWNAYEGWPDGVDQYNIYRNFTGDFTYLGSVPATTFTYTDDVIDLVEGEGNFCYYVEAQQVGPYLLGDPVYAFDEVSRSNVACAPQYPDIFVPNAFSPNGLNNVFLPVAVYVDLESYVFTVFSRFGGQIFQTKDKFEGWTGALKNGMEAAQGVYAYTIEYETANGEVGIKTGTITLYR